MKIVYKPTAGAFSLSRDSLLALEIYGGPEGAEAIAFCSDLGNRTNAELISFIEERRKIDPGFEVSLAIAKVEDNGVYIIDGSEGYEKIKVACRVKNGIVTGYS
ncbi:hypothetical protein [Paenibacillus sacheonensis]|uniref:Uncharacterized protein n=1 Tax=Paenibacillus sacheonensis TaxID=742054 RepID=A0A7X4YPA4_9BACL|nr:hypothetical protein [Paenibacillus sacheonensis]MBM7565237.1 hypothetical protein [Paenibacillus sacheonensis]NBC69987.1 hypothetical protein [Paenibacillus sacheonensis]